MKGWLSGVCELAGEADGGKHRGMAGEAFSRDGEGGAVIWRGAGLWQAEGDIDRFIEIQELQRDEALIVIHGEDGVILPQ